MATLSNRVFYQGGITPADSSVVGFESNRTRVVRYNLNLASDESASHINVVFGGDPNDIRISYGAPLNYFVNNLNDGLSFYFAISTDPDAFANAGYEYISSATGKAIFTQTGGYTVEENMEYKVSCDADILLYPDIQYYFWVFPGFSESGNGFYGWVYWNNTPIEVTLSGSAVETYTVSYNANGGFGAPAAQTKTQGVALTLSSTQPTKTNYVFKGWATTPNGVAVYQPSSSYTADTSITLYAVWQGVGLVFRNYKACINVGGSVKTYKVIVQVDGLNKSYKPAINYNVE